MEHKTTMGYTLNPATAVWFAIQHDNERGTTLAELPFRPNTDSTDHPFVSWEMAQIWVEVSRRNHTTG